MKILAFASAVAIVLVGCSDPPKSGQVIEKDHHDEYTIIQCAVYAQNGSCTMWLPVTYPAEYRLRVRDDADQTRVAWVDVTAEDYERYTPGSYWP